MQIRDTVSMKIATYIKVGFIPLLWLDPAIHHII